MKSNITGISNKHQFGRQYYYSNRKEHSYWIIEGDGTDTS